MQECYSEFRDALFLNYPKQMNMVSTIRTLRMMNILLNIAKQLIIGMH